MRSFDKSYMQMAEIWAQNSRALRNKVGCIIVKNNMIISDGFNGTPSGFENECENVICKQYWNDGRCGCGREEPSIKWCITENPCPFAELETKPYVLHAEANAITKLAKSTNNSEGSTLYVTLSPCLECAKLIIQAGIKKVVYKDEYRIKDGIELLKKAGIEVEQIQY